MPLSEEGIRGIGPLGLQGEELSDAPMLFENVLSTVVGVMSVGAIIWFIFQFIVGAYGWMSAGGDSKAIEAARKRIMNAVIGMVLVALALVLISTLGRLLDIDILNIQYFIFKISGTSLPPGGTSQ